MNCPSWRRREGESSLVSGSGRGDKNHEEAGWDVSTTCRQACLDTRTGHRGRPIARRGASKLRGCDMSLPGFTAEASIQRRHQVSHLLTSIAALAGPGVVQQAVTLKYNHWLVRWFHCAEKHSAWPKSFNPPFSGYPAKPGSCIYDCTYRTTYPASCTTGSCYECCNLALQNCYTTGQFTKGPCCAL
jgi:hypothetical protein